MGEEGRRPSNFESDMEEFYQKRIVARKGRQH